MLNNRTATGKAAGSAAAAALPSVAPTARHPVQPGAPKRASTVSEAVAQAPAATTLSSTYVTKEARKALFSTANEQPREVEADVRGAFPSWLSGSLLLNGGGDYSPVQHMFDGYGMVAKFRVEGGRVYGSHRYIASKAYQAYKKNGKMAYREFATPLPADGPLEAAANIFGQVARIVVNSPDFTDNASVNLVPLADGKLLAMSESLASTYRFDPATLSTLNQVTYTDGVPGTLTTAHPELMADGTLVNFSRSTPNGGFHVYKQDPQTLKRTEIAFIPDKNPMAGAWVHDFAMTANYAVICETPLYFNLGSLLMGTPTDYIFLDWVPTDGTRVHVVPLNGSKQVRTFAAPAFFAFHFANAYETADGKEIRMDMGLYRDPEIVNQLALQPLADFPGKNVAESFLRRMTIPLDGSSSTLPLPAPVVPDETTYGSFCEFPSVNPRYKGAAYRYVYCLSATRPTNMGNSLSKIDVETGATATWHEPGAAPGEPTFVPAPNATSEDDGVVVTLVMGADGRSFVLCLDGKTFTELGRAVLPYAVPYRFHGAFVPSQ